jgi:hypothetical protein
VSAEESLRRAQDLLDRLEQAKAELEQTGDAEQAVEVLAAMAETAKQIEAELQRALRGAELGKPERDADA